MKEADLPLDLAANDDISGEGSPTIGYVGRYALKKCLGQGGLGTVHAAYDPILSRTIAVKTLHFSSEDTDRKTLDAMILNEARAAAGLSHPHIVTVFDAGPYDQGVYIAMERLRGRDLRQLLKEGWAPSAAQSVSITRRVADALAYAHTKGVIHCDIKPANIFMIGRTMPKVLDFGIARVAHQQVVPGFEDMIAGSPYYLAPEQLNGGTIDRRCDVYSLGVVLYELLGGRRAFGGDSIESITRAVLKGPAKQVHEINPLVPQSLSQIVAKAMATEPDARYRSARHFSQALRSWLETEGNSSAESADEPKSRGTVARAVLASAFVAAAAGTLLWWAPWAEEPAALATSVAPKPAVAAARTATASQKHIAATSESGSLVAAPKGQTAAGAARDAAAAAAPILALAPDESKAAPQQSDVKPAKKPAAADSGKPARDKPAKTAKAAVAAATGVVQLAVSPWGQIEVDGKPAGTTPPLSRLTLSEGEHTITVRNQDYPPYTAKVRIGPDQPVTVRYRFGS